MTHAEALVARVVAELAGPGPRWRVPRVVAVQRRLDAALAEIARAVPDPKRRETLGFPVLPPERWCELIAARLATRFRRSAAHDPHTDGAKCLPAGPSSTGDSRRGREP